MCEQLRGRIEPTLVKRSLRAEEALEIRVEDLVMALEFVFPWPRFHFSKTVLLLAFEFLLVLVNGVDMAL